MRQKEEKEVERRVNTPFNLLMGRKLNVKIKNELYIDGCVSSNLPLEAAKKNNIKLAIKDTAEDTIDPISPEGLLFFTF